MTWLIGIDDTDMPETRGTGRLARMLHGELARRGLAPGGVTRHQLLVHPDVPYTTHNSAACLALEAEPPDAAALFDWVCGYVSAQSPAGADPGVCMAHAGRVGACARAFGRRAQQEVVDLDEARQAAATGDHLLAGLAGTRQGIIGALAAVGLRAGGDDGRFIALGDIRRLTGKVRVSAAKAAGIDEVSCDGPPAPGADEWIETFGWARPRLCGGRAVLFVERDADHGTDWVVSDRRNGGSGSGDTPPA